MDLTTFIQRKVIHYLMNCLLIIFLTYDVRISGSPFLKRPVASQFLSSGNTPRAKRMRSSHIAGSSSSLVELEGWQELIRGKRSGDTEIGLHSGRLGRLVGAIHRLETDTEQLKTFLPDTNQPHQPTDRGQQQQEEQLTGKPQQLEAHSEGFLDRDFPLAQHTTQHLTPHDLMEKIEGTLLMLEEERREREREEEEEGKNIMSEYHGPDRADDNKDIW